MLFDTLTVNLKCPVTGKLARNSVQLFFRNCFRDKAFQAGDLLDNLPAEYNNTWIATAYICEACSPKTKRGKSHFIKVDDQKWHRCYLRVKNSRIMEVIGEEEFNSRGIKDYVEDI